MSDGEGHPTDRREEPMNLSRKIKKRAEQTMANPPTKLQLPGGVEVRKFQFRITAVDHRGRPVAFELALPGTASDCCLWASPEFIDHKLPDDLGERVRQRSASTQQSGGES